MFYTTTLFTISSVPVSTRQKIQIPLDKLLDVQIWLKKLVEEGKKVQV